MWKPVWYQWRAFEWALNKWSSENRVSTIYDAALMLLLQGGVGRGVPPPSQSMWAKVNEFVFGL